MKPMTMLVSSDGQWLPEGGAELAAVLDDADPDYDAAGYAVRNLGYIRFQILGNSLVEIELHPARVDAPGAARGAAAAVVLAGQAVSDQIP